MEQRLRLHKELVEAVAKCKLCRLHLERRNPVPGEGPVPAKVMIVGEAPGRREDELGRPFVGQAGKLLDRLLEQAGLSRGEVYITNVVKCRPPGNRDPRQDEIESCLGYLRRQIALVQPEVIVTVGRISGATLFKLAGLKWRNLRAERGKPVNVVIEGIRVVLYPTFHPAAALYNREILPLLEEDFRRLGGIIGGSRSRGKTLLDYM